jgi:DNA replication protein DnaC
MNATIEIVPSVLDRIRKTLVGLKMPRALEVLDQTVRQLERGETSALEVIDTLFAEELTLRENRRVKMALRMAKLSTIKTLAGFDFSFQPSLDRNRILALAQLDFIDRNEVIHFLGPPESDSYCPPRYIIRMPSHFDAGRETPAAAYAVLPRRA